jgi:hypothetical protein
MHESMRPYDYSGPINFGDSVFVAEIQAAEYDEDRKYAVEVLARQLQLSCDQEIADKLCYVVGGVVLHTDKHGQISDTYTDDMYARLVSFLPKQYFDRWYVTAQLEDADTGKYFDLLISAEKGHEFALLPDYPLHYNAATDARHKFIAEKAIDAADYLQKASSLLGRSSLKNALMYEVDVIEFYLGATHGLAVGDHIAVTGVKSTKYAGSDKIVELSPNNESSYIGDFIGVTAYEEYVNGCRFNRLCVALQSDDGDIILQPCQWLYELNVARV